MARYQDLHPAFTKMRLIANLLRQCDWMLQEKQYYYRQTISGDITDQERRYYHLLGWYIKTSYELIAVLGSGVYGEPDDNCDPKEQCSEEVEDE